MFQRTGSALALLAAISLLSITTASAGERSERHRAHKRPTVVVKVDLGRRHHRPSRQRDTYSGDVDIYSRRNVGQWSYGTMPASQDVIVTVPSAKIIHVDRLEENAACEMQAGVCVIKP